MSEKSPLSQAPSTREADIAHTLVRLASRYADRDDELELLRDVVDSCVRILDGDAAGVSLASGGRLGFVIATSETMDVIELIQAEHQEGPCMEAFTTGETALVPDLTQRRGQWPTWGPRALELGFRAAVAFPMRRGADTIGVIDFYATRRRKLNARDVLVGGVLAEMATIAVLGRREADDLRTVNEQLQEALDTRVLIEQAKGILAERHGLGPDEAFGRLRQFARRHRMKLRQVARSVVEGDLEPA